MTSDYLAKLTTAVSSLLKQKKLFTTVQELKQEILDVKEPFVWSVINLNDLDCELPDNIKSGWIFVLRKDVPSGCHYHPNSVQHMVMIEGQGQANVSGITKRMVRFGSGPNAIDDVWFVIDENVPHEFFPEEQDMVVVS